MCDWIAIKSPDKCLLAPNDFGSISFHLISFCCCCVWHMYDHTVCTWILFTTFTLISDSPSLSSSIWLRLWLAMRHIRPFCRCVLLLHEFGQQPVFFVVCHIYEMISTILMYSRYRISRCSVMEARNVSDSRLSWRGSQYAMMNSTHVGAYWITHVRIHIQMHELRSKHLDGCSLLTHVSAEYKPYGDVKITYQFSHLILLFKYLKMR